MTLLDWLIVLLIIVPVLPFLASLVLVRHIRSRAVSLHERALIAVRDWLVASIAGLLALSRLDLLNIDGETAITMLALAMLLVSLPSAYWLYLYWRGGFR